MIDKLFPLYIALFILTLTVTVITEKKLIPRLTSRAKQPIYDGGPSWHLKKSGTPTMGGLAFLLASVIAALVGALFALIFISEETALSIIISIAYAVINSAIGIFDDLKKLKRKKNAGLSPKGKLVLQFIAAILFLCARRIFLNDGTFLSFSFGNIELGFFYYPLAVFLLLGIVNCANLTDGIDGLASSVAFAIGVSSFYISAALVPEGSILSAILIGASIGFLVFNLHPAKIFMGDTGSLFIGALASATVFTLKNPLLILFLGATFIIEGFSVVLQVVYFKLTHKRIFIMAPLHHHLEKHGWSENKICMTAIFLTMITAIPAYFFYLP